MQLDGRYRLDQLLGEGASAWVFAALDTRLQRVVALKVFKPQGADGGLLHGQGFLEEGRTLAKVVHPHIVLVHDVGETPDGLGYLVMELSATGNLEQELLRRAPLPVEETLALLLPLLGALACAHEQGIIHRDVKPANIALVRQGGQTRAKLLDFGIAKPESTGSETALGTPAYMAPEQARGDALSPAADVWALAVVFFRCLSGGLPFEANTSTATLLKLVGERAPRFAEACPSLPPNLAIALDRALEPQPARRYPDMRVFAHALARACSADRVIVSVKPEPIGLPDFERWLTEADEQTEPLSSAQKNAIMQAVSSKAAPFAGRASSWPAALPTLPVVAPRHPWFAESQPDLIILVFPPAPSDDEVRVGVRAMEEFFVHSPIRRPWVVDLRQLQGSNATQRACFSEYEKRVAEATQRFVPRLAYIAPTSFLGGLLTAVFWASPPVYTYRVFADRAAGEAWAREDEDPRQRAQS